MAAEAQKGWPSRDHLDRQLSPRRSRVQARASERESLAETACICSWADGRGSGRGRRGRCGAGPPPFTQHPSVRSENNGADVHHTRAIDYRSTRDHHRTHHDGGTHDDRTAGHRRALDIRGSVDTDLPAARDDHPVDHHPAPDAKSARQAPGKAHLHARAGAFLSTRPGFQRGCAHRE